jgi:hypothetical protein
LTVSPATCSLRYVTAQQEAEAALSRWVKQRQEADAEREELARARDDLVLAALAAGITKHRIHVLTGIARTTIDKIVSEGGER